MIACHRESYVLHYSSNLGILLFNRWILRKIILLWYRNSILIILYRLLLLFFNLFKINIVILRMKLKDYLINRDHLEIIICLIILVRLVCVLLHWNIIYFNLLRLIRLLITWGLIDYICWILIILNLGVLTNFLSVII